MQTHGQMGSDALAYISGYIQICSGILKLCAGGGGYTDSKQCHKRPLCVQNEGKRAKSAHELMACSRHTVQPVCTRSSSCIQPFHVRDQGKLNADFRSYALRNAVSAAILLMAASVQNVSQ